MCELLCGDRGRRLIGRVPGVKLGAVLQCAGVVLIHEVSFPRSVRAVGRNEDLVNPETGLESIQVIGQGQIEER